MDELKERGIPIESPPLEAANADEKMHEERYEQSHEKSLKFKYMPPEIWLIIMKHLNGRDLSSAAMVCRKWLDFTNEEKKLRGPNCFIAQIKRDEERLMIINDCQPNDFNKQLTIKPSIGFFFLPEHKAYLFYSVKDPICKLLPTNCKTIMLFTHTIILNKKISRSENRGQFLFCFNMVCAFLPQIPNIELSMFIVTEKISEKDKYTEGYAEYIQMIEKLIQNHVTSACLMLFCNNYGRSIASNMAHFAYFRLNEKEKMGFLCGEVQELLTNETVNPCEPYCVALFITGSIQARSIVLEEYLTTELVKEKLKLFKQQVKLQKHSIGFISSSYIQAANMKDEDFTIFKEFFPQIPLVGFSNICSSISERDTSTSDVELVLPRFRQWHNTCLTTFMILTYD